MDAEDLALLKLSHRARQFDMLLCTALPVLSAHKPLCKKNTNDHPPNLFSYSQGSSLAEASGGNGPPSSEQF